MRHICLIVVLTVTFSLQSQHSTINNITDRELARQDSIWFARNPGLLPIWETLEEKNMRLAQEPSKRVPVVSRPAPPPPVRNIAEYEPMEGVSIAYPRKFGIPTSLIKEMAEDVIVYCVADNSQDAEDIMQSGGVNMDNVTLIDAQLNSIYTRDFGPWWIVNGDSEIGIVDFEYNRNRPDDNRVNAKLGSELGVTVYKMDLTTCGGNYMTDGHYISASTNLVWNENKNYTHDQIDDIMNEYLGIETYHVVDDPNLGTDIDHIDCWGKFLAPDKILIREVPSSNSDYNALESTVEYFESQTSSYGTPYKIYRIISIEKNEGYTNSLILNNKVLVPLSETSNDDPSLEVYKEAMPGYEIIGFTNSVQSWQNYDALHCRTKGIADRGMLSISHLPLHDTVTSVDGEGYTVEATIIPYSGENLTADSLLVFYKPEGETDFSSVLFEHVSDNTYQAVIPQLSESVEMSYYIHAADESGRSENHPYIGASDSHVYFAESLGTFAGFNNQPVLKNIVLRNYPNPCISYTKIIYRLPSGAHNAKISVYNNNGRLIREWAINNSDSFIVWDGTDTHGQKVSTGIYFYTIQCSKFVMTKRLHLVR